MSHHVFYCSTQLDTYVAYSIYLNEEPEDTKELCIICTHKEGEDDHIVSPKNYESWQVLLDAAKV